MNNPQLYWVAGILEGEGCFTNNRRKAGKQGKIYNAPRIEVNMKDEDIIRRLHEYLGVGLVHGPYLKTNPKHSAMWRFVINKKDDVCQVMQTVFPLMGERRQSQIISALKECGLSLEIVAQ